MNSLTKEQLISLQNELNARKCIILLKFSAKWCKPCKNIKPLCERYFATMPRNILLFDIDVDEHMDLYAQFKRYKMLKGVPTMMMWAPTLAEHENAWYVPDETVSGGDEREVQQFFDKCTRVALAVQQ